MIQVLNCNDMSSGMTDISIPMFVAQDSRLLKVICDDFDDDDEPEHVPIFIPKAYMNKIMEYYNHYSDYFLNNTQLTDEDKFNVISQSMLDFPQNQHKIQQDREKWRPRRNDIPTETLYVGFSDSEGNTTNVANPDNLTTLELANRLSIKLDFIECWTNDFEKDFIKSIHFISPDADDFPKDGISFATDGTPILSAFLLHKYANYMLINSFLCFMQAVITHHNHTISQ